MKGIWIGALVGVAIVGAVIYAASRRWASGLPAASSGTELRVPRPVPAQPAAAAPSAQPGADGAPQDWRRLLEAKGLARYAPALAKVVRPAVQLTTRKVAVEALALGQSRIGGVPDLPARFPWPMYGDKPLAFIAEIDLAEVARVMPDGPLPKRGQLWFFYLSDQEHWGDEPGDAGSSVVHYEADGPLVRRALPDAVPSEGRFTPCAVAFRRYGDIPDGEDERSPVTKSDDATQEAYADVRSHVASAGATSHKLLGYAEPIQNPMEIDCATATDPAYGASTARGPDNPRYQQLDAAKFDWRLLMQIDSDDAADMMWGDAGRLYFWIRDQDLRARRFDKTWMIFQCG